MAKKKNILEDIQKYWKGKNVPQQWYSNKEPFTIQWFNELSLKRYKLYYEYIYEDCEFFDHKNEEVLEVGCGVGTDLVEYARNGSIVSGVDLGEDQVNLTKLNFELRNLSYKEIQRADAENLPFENESFDLVFSFGVLHHTSNTQKAIDEVHRVLKPDGQAIIMLYARGWKHYLKRCFIHGILLGKWFKYRFNWQKVYNEVSEVNGSSPKTGVYTKKQVGNMFRSFKEVKIKKKRLGEFFDYPPYRTFIFPKFIKRVFYFFGFENLLGENWLIKVYKSPLPKKTPISTVVFKKY